MPDAEAVVGRSSAARRFVAHFEERVAGLLLVILLFVVLLDIGTRNLLGMSLIWPEEVSRILFVWSVFIGGGAALKVEKLITIDVPYRYLGPGWRRGIDVAAFLVVAVCLVVLCVFGIVFFARFARDATPTTGIPKGYFYGAVPVGSLLMFVRLVQWIRVRLRRHSPTGQALVV